MKKRTPTIPAPNVFDGAGMVLIILREIARTCDFSFLGNSKPRRGVMF